MLIRPEEITVAALRADLALQRHHYGSLRLQLLTLKEGLGTIRSTETQSRQRHIVAEGDTIQIVAARLFGSPDYWRAIADHNKLQYPYLIYPGQILDIPDVE
jgi:nucleoid-associated protein YgaU